MPQYRLLLPLQRAGIRLDAGTVLSTAMPEGTLYYISPQAGDDLLERGAAELDTAPVLTGERLREPGWKVEHRERTDSPDDYCAPWG